MLDKRFHFWTNGCGWYFKYTDKIGVERQFGPWLNRQIAEQEASKHEGQL